MAAALVQDIGTYNSGGADANTIVLSVTKTITSGNVVVVAAAISGTSATTPTCSDNLGNTYALIEQATHTTIHKAALFVAPVTSAGSLTTITASFGFYSTGRTLIAAEFSGVGTLSEAGGGTSGTSGTGTWVNSKTIPANGLAVGLVAPYDPSRTQTIGSASGSPSTTAYLDAQQTAAAVSLSLCYAIAGGSNVTGFSGTTTFTSNEWVSAGGLFNPSVVTPTWTTPADTVSMSTTPELKFNSPTSAVAQHFYLELDTANTFNTGNLRTYRSDQVQTNWDYWNGSTWTAMPSTGLPSGSSGNEIRYTVTSALSSTTWYRRVRAGTLS